MTEKPAAGAPAEAEGGFADLLADLETFAKSLPGEGEDTAAGAGGADGDDTEAGGNADGDDTEAGAGADGEDGAAGGEEPFGKSFEVVLADGTKAEAFDGTAMMKALHDENVALRSQGIELTRGMTTLVPLVKSLLKERAEDRKLLKAMDARLAKLGGAGSGRKVVLRVDEKPPLGGGGADAAPPKAPEMSQDEIMAKAQSLLSEGKIDVIGANRVFTHTSRGLGVPEDLRTLFARS